MEDWISQMVASLREVFSNDALFVFVISALPMIEVRGAIPVAVSSGIPMGTAYILSSASAFLVAPMLMGIFRPLLNALKKTKTFKRLAGVLEQTFSAKADKIEKKAEEKASSHKRNIFYKSLGLFLFVAIPLPMTGIWTGSVVAAFLDLNYWYSILSLIAGNFVAAGIILLFTYVLGGYSYIILIVLAVFILISIAGVAVTLHQKNKSVKNK
jgi:uncharacterized membrane protein